MRLPPRSFTLLFAAALPVLACGRTETKAAGAVAAAPAADLPPFEQEITSINGTVTLPGVWRYGYSIVDRPDTLHGSHRAIEFLYSADTSSGVPPRLLLVIRVYERAAWDKVKASQEGRARVMAEHDGKVYAFSIVTASPYPANSVSTLRVDQMMMALMAETSPFKLRFK